MLPYPPAGHFEHLVLLGGPHWLRDLAAELGVARKISGEIPPEGSADALVILEDAGVDFAEASRCLCTGAAVYWEVGRRWNSYWSSTPGAIRRRLLKAGLTPLVTYWARPDFRYASMYLPIDVRRVLGWYVETLMEPKTLVRRTARFILKFFARMTGAWSLGLAPRYAVTATSGRADKERVALSLPIDSLARDGQHQRLVVLLGGRDSSRRVIVFSFSPNAERPSAVVKFWRLPDRNANTETEQATLKQIRSRLDAGARRTLPEPRGTLRWGEIVASIESYAPGPSLSRLMNTWARPLRRKLEDFRLVVDWIGEFHQQAQVSRGPWDGAALETWVEKPVSSYRDAFGALPDADGLFTAVRQRARALLGLPMPIVWAHPDLTGANIHIDRRQVRVIDWSGTVARLPLFDVFYFVMLWTCRVRNLRGIDARLRCFRELFIESVSGDSIVRAVRGALTRYMAKLGIDARFFPLLLALNWVFRSAECFDRSEAVARREPGVNPHPGESYVEYVHLLAEKSDKLFSEAAARPWWMA